MSKMEMDSVMVRRLWVVVVEVGYTKQVLVQVAVLNYQSMFQEWHGVDIVCSTMQPPYSMYDCTWLSQ